MTCPALLLRNTTDDPTWTSLIYHDHVSWFPGGAYVVQKLFCEHYAERRLASSTGTFRDLPTNRKSFFDEIATMKPEGWTPGTLDAIATASAGGRFVIKAVNYTSRPNTLLVKFTGAGAPEKAAATLHTITAAPETKASIEQPAIIATVARPFNYAKDLTIDLAPHTVAVLEIRPSS